MLKWLMLFLSLNSSWGAETHSQQTVWQDLGTTFKWMFQGSYRQFNKNNLYHLMVGVPTNYIAFENDKAIFNRMSGKPSKFIKAVSNFNIFLSFPLLQAVSYTIGRKNKDQRLMRYSMEVLSAQYLAMVESALLSLIKIHPRPEQNNLNVWEVNFRGESSWPSGHVIPASILFFKTFQFYGPAWSLLPASLMIVTGFERVKSKKHWFSDVIGGFFVSLFAAEGVRAAGENPNNHPVFKWIYENDVKFSYQGTGEDFLYQVSWAF